MTNRLQQNAVDLQRELDWFARVLDTRFKLYFGQECEYSSVFDVTPPLLDDSESPYAEFVKQFGPSFAERVALVLSLVPHVKPKLLDIFFTRNNTFDRRFTEFGGLHEATGEFLPTGETLVFVLAADDLQTRFETFQMFEAAHYFATHNILRLEEQSDSASLKAPLRISEDLLLRITTGQSKRPNFSANFPARFIETPLTWDDLVLHPGTRRQVGEIETWLQHGDTLLNEWGMAGKLRPGYRSLFYGPPGTGKTMTACLLGKATNRDVYRVDLSMVISKYIGETEKNLGKVFDQAQRKDWILFFDEADALFGKRTETQSSHDRFANQEVAFLLQRIEVFDGIAILASNQKENIDQAFARRFESVIHFPLPRPQERLLLWQQGFSPSAKLSEDIDLQAIAEEFALSGGSIMNVIRYASLESLKNGDGVVSKQDLLNGIRQEFHKEGRLP
ncbi:MAG: ATP-binding protein [Planctomycetaceae bacterium]|nr:ATP-binding protein [Planctomycetaceae bacterium]